MDGSWISASLEREREVKKGISPERKGVKVRPASRVKTRVRKRAKETTRCPFFDKKRVRAERQELLAAAPETGESVGEECGAPTTKKDGLSSALTAVM